MIEASFEPQKSHRAAIARVYQYDTGQRMRMHGLPGPEELNEKDSFLSGESVTVQAQYSWKGDMRSEMRIASWDEESGCWLAEVPDEFMLRSEPVSVHIYVMYGSDEETTRCKTMYEATFTPIGRTAPSSEATPEQISQWEALVQEINLTLARVNTAISDTNGVATQAQEAAAAAETAAQNAENTKREESQKADAAVQAANTAAQEARQAAASAQLAGNAWASGLLEAVTLAADQEATASLGSGPEGQRRITLGIPKGEKGEKGETGRSGVRFSIENGILSITTEA